MLFDLLLSKNGLSLERLVTLCRVAQSGSIVAAACGDDNRQIQYGRQISDLGQFLGEDVQLLDKTSKPFRLTPEGEELAALCMHYFSGLEDFTRKCRSTPVKLTIGAGESLIQWHLIPNVWPRLKKAIPGASTVFRNLQTNAIIEGLISGALDIGCVRLDALKDFQRLQHGPTWETSFRLFVPKGVGPKLIEPVPLSTLLLLPLAVLEGDGVYRRILNEAAQKLSVDVNIVLECSSLTQVALVVGSDGCCGLLPAHARSQFAPNLVHDYSVEGLEELHGEMCFAWNPRRVEARPVLAQAVSLLS